MRQTTFARSGGPKIRAYRIWVPWALVVLSRELLTSPVKYRENQGCATLATRTRSFGNTARCTVLPASEVQLLPTRTLAIRVRSLANRIYREAKLGTAFSGRREC